MNKTPQRFVQLDCNMIIDINSITRIDVFDGYVRIYFSDTDRGHRLWQDEWEKIKKYLPIAHINDLL